MKSVVIFVALISASQALWEGPNPCDRRMKLPNFDGPVNDPRDCADYFYCISGHPFNARCPDGYHFDEEREVCDLPRYVKCGKCPDVGISTMANPDSCTKWILCVNGVPLNRNCGPGTRFNANIGTCDLEENVSCARDTCSTLDGGIGIAPSPDNCRKFFICYGGDKLVRSSCANGLSFDIVTKQCVRLGTGTCFPGATLE